MLFRSVSSSHSPAVPHMGPHATSLSHQCPTAQPSFTGQPHWKYSSQVGATFASAAPTVLTPPPLWDVVPSQALLLPPGLSPTAAAVALPLPSTNILSYRASSAWCPASCGSQHQAHWSPFQGSFLSLTVEGISLFPGGWVTRSCLGSLTHAGLTVASIFPWENIHQLLLSFARFQSWGRIVSVFLPCGSQGAPKEKPVTGSVPYASSCNGRQVPWTAA